MKNIICIFRYFVQITAIKSADISGRQYYELKLKETNDGIIKHRSVLISIIYVQSFELSAGVYHLYDLYEMF